MIWTAFSIGVALVLWAIAGGIAASNRMKQGKDARDRSLRGQIEYADRLTGRR